MIRLIKGSERQNIKRQDVTLFRVRAGLKGGRDETGDGVAEDQEHAI